MFGGRRNGEATLPRFGEGLLSAPAIAKGLWDFSKRKPLGAVGAFILLGLVVIAIFAPVIAPQDPDQIHPYQTWATPGTDSYTRVDKVIETDLYILGTDEAGRDNMSRLIYGARVSLQVGIMSVLIGITAGALMGIVSAYVGGAFDLGFQRVVDAFMAFPGIILALGIVAILGPSVWNVIWALSFFVAPGTARTIRSQVLSIKEMDYILAARAIGVSPARTILRHILPNCMAIYMILASLTLGTAITAEASLSFLGIGVPTTTATWGGMLHSASIDFLLAAQWSPIAPGIAIALAVYGANLFGDAMRDVLDPRLRGSS